jgi:hypothetical protein
MARDEAILSIIDTSVALRENRHPGKIAERQGANATRSSHDAARAAS